MNRPIIYKIENLINGKVYIGQTIQTFGRRVSEHKHRANLGERDHKLYLALRKYGIDNFKFTIICTALAKEFLDELEIFFIKQYNSYNRGYNMTCGGDSVSIETREKLSKVHKGRKVPWIHKVHETRRKNGTYGKNFEVRTPTGEIAKGKNLLQFCRDNGLDLSNLYRTRSKPNCCKGYVFLRTFNDYPEGEYA